MELVDQLGGDTSPYSALVGLGIFAVQLRYDEPADWEMPAWPEIVHLVEQLLDEAGCSTDS